MSLMEVLSNAPVCARYKVMKSCWREHPTDRPTASALLESFENLLEHEMVQLLNGYYHAISFQHVHNSHLLYIANFGYLVCV